MAIEWRIKKGIVDSWYEMNFTAGEDGPSAQVNLYKNEVGKWMVSSHSLGWAATPLELDYSKGITLGEAKRATEAKVLIHYNNLANLYDTMRYGLGEDIIKKENEVKEAIVAKVQSLVDDGHSPERPVKSYMVTTTDYNEAFLVAMKSYGEENIIEAAKNAAEQMVKEVANRRGLSSYLSSDAETSKVDDILGPEANQMLQNIKNSLHGEEHEDDESLER